MHLDIILSHPARLGLLSVMVVTWIANVTAYHVILPEAWINSTDPIFLNFTLLPAHSWTYSVRNAWWEVQKSDPVMSHPLDADILGQGVVWWENSQNSLGLGRGISSRQLTVIIEAKSAGQVSIIPVTVHHKFAGQSIAANYPHVIQSYQSSKPCSRNSRPSLPLLNITSAIPDFVKQRNWQLLLDRKDQDVFTILDGGVWSKSGFCRGQTRTGQHTGHTLHNAYHTITVQYSSAVDGDTASQSVDLIFGPISPKGNSIRPLKHHKRRHRKTRAASLFFTAPFYSTFVVEELTPPVYVIQMNVSGASKPVKFSMTALADSRSQSLFSIDAESGVVRTETQLDREAIAQHSFRVTAVSSTDRWTTATTTLIIKVGDVNDNVPIFEKAEYDVSISESVAVGAVVITVHAGDSDEGGNGQVTYSLIGSKGQSEPFQVDAKNGVVTTRLPLDREALETYLLYIKAEDGGNLQTVRGEDDQKKSSITKILVKVTDENDNTPAINGTCSLTLKEDLDWTTLPTIVRLQAVDYDAGVNGQIRYFIVGGNPSGQFILDSMTGDLKVAAPLDYESERKYRLVIRIQDSGSPPRSNTTVCTIDILDSNDNEPKFSTNMYSASLAEDVHIGYPVVQTQAYDPEGKIIYSIKNHSSLLDVLPFVIDPESGWITTSARLDRERQGQYEFTVLATDLGLPARSSSATVRVEILDVNDNGPVFDQRDYNVSVSEQSLAGTQILSLRAQDRDLNPRLTYQIISGNQDGTFSVINQNGLGLILLSKSVQHRHAQRCELLLEVADETGKNDRVRVLIHILAANLHRPTFLNAPFRIQIPENIPVGTTVIELRAMDDDLGENGRITYLMSSDPILTDSFHLAAETGVLKTTKPLDREMLAVYTVPVTATDHGVPSLYDTTDVLIELLDVNDNVPIFSQTSYFVAVKEDVSPQTSILQVSAVDSDFGLNGLITYTFEGGNSGNGTFVIDAALGIVRTNIPLDRELFDVYELTALAVDRGTLSLTATVVISVKILDVNDNAPIFAAEVLTFYAPENLTIGSTVAEILVSDPDDGANADIECYIIGGPDADSFALLSRPDKSPPLLSNLVELDYEGQKQHYQLVIRASSPPLQTDVTVNIYVTDVNDNAPEMKDFRIILNNYPHHFPRDGLIGKLPVTDRDATAKLEYSITTGNRHGLLSIHPDGEMQLSATLNSDVPYSSQFTIEVSDGVNTVSAICVLMVVPVDDEMLANSVTLQAANVTARDLLEPAIYDRLVESLAYISQCPPESMFIFAIIDETDAHIPVVNISFAAKLSGGDGVFIQAEKLRERFFVQHKLLRNMTSLPILPPDDNFCLREPCPNFEKCRSVQKFSSAPSRFTTTDTFLFRSVQPLSTFACECPSEFSGIAGHYSCDKEINLCFSNPCQGNGTCTSTESGFHCNCAEGFTGSQCETDLPTAACYDGLCRSPSICSARSDGPVECLDCPKDEYHTSSCQLTTRSFSIEKKSYALFSGIRARTRFKLSLKIATTKKAGMLIYNGRFLPRADFLALEVVNSSIHFSFSLGRENARVSVPVMIADGEWHRIDIHYMNKSARVIVDNCDFVLALEHGQELDYQCAGVAMLTLEPHCFNSGALCHRFLDLTGPMYVGGLPDDRMDSRLSSQFFDGCIKDLMVDHHLMDMNQFMEEHATSSGCHAKDDYCVKQPCLNGGTCFSGWGKKDCKCAKSFTGEDCSTENGEEFQLDGDGYMLTQQGPLSQTSLNLQFDFRPTNSSGILATVHLGDLTILTVRLSGYYIVATGTHGDVIDGETRVTAGTWHRMTIMSDDDLFSIFLDENHELDILPTSSKMEGAFSAVLGGRENIIGPASGFSGCIRNVFSQKRKALFSFRSNVQDGCSDPQRYCRSSTCAGEHSQCRELSHSYRCECKKGYIGSQCRDVCDFDPCKNGICVHSTETHLGYKCRCFANFTGEYCEESAPQACKPAWWGYPLCGPCQCPALDGFDPICDKVTGACHCKENFYKNADSDGCISCDCSAVGSLGKQCDTDGQCPCRNGVTGKKCDMCPSVSAELGSDGCQEVYGACPATQNIETLLRWERTPFASSSYQRCPIGSVGDAVRTCDLATKSWTAPDFTNCSSVSFELATSMLKEYMTGRLSLDDFIVMRIIGELQQSLGITMKSSGLFQSDLFVAKELLSAILTYEVIQTPMNFTHRLHSQFLPALVECFSHIFDFHQAELWKSLSQTHQELRGISINHLVNLFHQYIRLVAFHAEETAVRPFEIVAKNLKVGVRDVSKDEFLPATFSGKPGYVRLHSTDHLRYSRSHNEPQLDGQSMSRKFAYYVEYAALPSLLIQTSPNTSSSSRTLEAHSRAFFFGSISDQYTEAVYEFRLSGKGHEEARLAATVVCRNWDFGTEKWIQNRCITLSRNTTHLNCSCPTELFVAIVGENPEELNIFQLNLTVFLFNTVVTLLAIVVNLTCLTLLIATRSSLDSVRVAQNTVFAALVVDVIILLITDLSWNTLIRKILACLLHFFVLSRSCWCLAQSLMLYQLAKNGFHNFIRRYFLLGYGIPSVIVGLSVGLTPESYGTGNFCWLILDDYLNLSLIGPVTSIIFLILTVLLIAHCTLSHRKKSNLDSLPSKDIRRNFLVCVGVSMFFVASLSLVVVAVNFRITSIGYVYPIFVLCQSIFLFAFLCLKTAEVGSLMHEKVLWFVRRKVDSFTARGKNGKLSDSVRETYRNPGIIISESTTYHRTTQPDKDISGSFGGHSDTSTIRRSEQSIPGQFGNPVNGTLNDFQKGSDGTNDDTLSVHSSLFTQETQHSFDGLCHDRNEIHSPYLGREPQRAASSASTFGGPLTAWNSLPHNIRDGTVPRSPKAIGSGKTAPPAQPPGQKNQTFATFRPPSKTGQSAGHLIDTVTGELVSGSQPSLLLPPEQFRTPVAHTFLDLQHTEAGTAV